VITDSAVSALRLAVVVRWLGRGSGSRGSVTLGVSTSRRRWWGNITAGAIGVIHFLELGGIIARGGPQDVREGSIGSSSGEGYVGANGGLKTAVGTIRSTSSG
jgi:hypothetical protein